MATQIEYCEKVAKILVDETTQFWMSVVQDEQLQQLSTELHEVEAQLTEMQESMKMMPLVVDVSK